MLKIFCDFEIKTYHLVSARWPDLVIDNQKKKKESLPNRRLRRPVRPQGKIKRKKKKR